MSSTAAPAVPPRVKMVHPVDEVLPPQKLAVYGLQHVMAFYAGAVVVPILLASSIGLNESQLIHLINADLFTCGIASLLQSVGIWKIGVRLPLLQGVTFTAVSPMIVIGLDHGKGTAGLVYIYGAVIIAGIFTFLLAPFFGMLVRYFPPVVTGTVITIIGATLVPVAAMDAGGGNGAFYSTFFPADGARPLSGPAAFGSYTNLVLAGVTILIILAITRFGRGFFATVAVLLGLVLGTFIAWVSGNANFHPVQTAKWVGFTEPFHFGAPKFALVPILLMVVVMIITAVETTGDVFATGQIVEKSISKDDITRALRADGLATFLGGIMNSFPYTCFAENVGLVRLTRVRSRWVVATAGGIMIVLGLIPKAGAIVSCIPNSVLGGAALVMFGTVAAVGIQTLSRVDFHNHRNVTIVAVSIGIALIPVGTPSVNNAVAFFSKLPDNVQAFVGSGITIGSFAAILLNLLLNVWGGRQEDERERRAQVTVDELNRMPRAQFLAVVGPVYQGSSGIVEAVADQRPFADGAALRTSLQDRLFALPADQQLQLMHSYPALAGSALLAGELGEYSVIDQAQAGLTFLSEEEQNAFGELNDAYHEKFGFPLIIALRDLSSEQVLEQGWQRLDNSPTQEHAAALLEIAKIANHRLGDAVAGTDPMGASRAASLVRLQ
jgi:OHCU decarboxylase